MDSAKNAALRASDLARRMLTFSKGGDPVRRMVDVKEIVINSINLSLRGSNLIGRVKFDMDLPRILADPGQLAQVMDNLVINAREASSSGGQLSVTGSCLRLKDDEVASLPAGDYIEIAIEDHGAGIPQGILDKIFDPYFTTKATGNGIGLTTCYSILKKHGGGITVQSRIGEGTLFQIYLPVRQGGEEQLADQPALPRTSGSGRILIIDDDRTIRKTLADLLESLHYAATAVESGEKGLAVYQKAMQDGNPFDVILLDGTIPGGMGGEAAFHVFREMDPTVRVILCSGYSDNRVSAHWREIGFAAVLPKPFSMRELQETLCRLLGSSHTEP